MEKAPNGRWLKFYTFWMFYYQTQKAFISRQNNIHIGHNRCIQGCRQQSRDLGIPHLGIFSVMLQQFVMSAFLNEASIVQNNDSVCNLHRGKPMDYEDDRGTLGKLSKDSDINT